MDRDKNDQTALTIIFLIGAFYLAKILIRLLSTLYKIFLGTRITTERYGKDSWAVITGSTDGIGKELAF